jgi:rhodanese-related sulfurtransferase
MTSKGPQEPFKRIAVDEAKRMIDTGKYEVVDVRQPHEWEKGHIKGAKLIPVDALYERIGEVSKEKEVIFYCAAGVRSALACEIAAAMGLTKLYNVEGGMEAWKAKAFPFLTGR